MAWGGDIAGVLDVCLGGRGLDLNFGGSSLMSPKAGCVCGRANLHAFFCALIPESATFLGLLVAVCPVLGNKGEGLVGWVMRGEHTGI